MKNFLLSSALAVCALSASAQLTNYSVGQTAPDWTVTDVHGVSHNLYTLTGSGQYVLIDFFFTTCGPCQATAPTITEFYQKYGCNGGDVFVISIDNGDSDAEVLAYENTYPGPNSNPSASGNDGGGNAVNSDYGPAAYPTVVLISPDNKFLNTDIWPIGSIADIEGAFPAGAITEMSCATGVADQVQANNSLNNMYPVPATNQTTLEFTIAEASDVSFTVYDVLGQKVTGTREMSYQAGEHTYPMSLEDVPAGNYLVYMTVGTEVLSAQKLIVFK